MFSPTNIINETASTEEEKINTRQVSLEIN